MRRTKIVIIQQVGQILFRVTQGSDGRLWLMTYNLTRCVWGNKKVTNLDEVRGFGIEIDQDKAAA